MSNRRDFIKTSAIATVAVALNSFRSREEDEPEVASAHRETLELC